MSALPATPIHPHNPSSGARLVSTEGHSLPLLGAELQVDAAAGVARVVLRQRFQNPHEHPLHLRYQVPLPADAAVSGYAFSFAGRRIVGEVDKRSAARERFEQAVIEGKSAALLEQDRSSSFNQELGNVPPGAEVVCELELDQPLVWRREGEGGWEWRFPTTLAPRFAGAPGRVADLERVTVDIADRPLAPRMSLALAIRDAGVEPSALRSPSHALSCQARDQGLHVELRADAGVALDRDLVVRWPAAVETIGASLDHARPPAEHPRSASAFAQLVLTPPKQVRERLARDLIVLLDTSGSMRGEPLAQAKAVAEALIRSLPAGDRLELVEFSTRPRRWQPDPVVISAQTRAQALTWLRSLRATGGTQMREGILNALTPLRTEAQRQVLLITDGLISFEHEIIAAIQTHLPMGSRVHTLGIGHAVNRSLTRPAARAGKGVEQIIAPGESATRAAETLVAAMQDPIVVDVEVSGSALRTKACPRIPDLLAGAPARIPLELAPEGGQLLVRGRLPQGLWEEEVEVPALAPGEGSQALARVFARERVEELELARAQARGAGADQHDAGIEALGLEFGISTRMTSWIAVTQEATVDPSDPTRRETMPHELPAGMSAEGIGLRAAEDPNRVVRNAEGVIVKAAPRRREPKILGYISLPTQAAPRGRAKPPTPSGPHRRIARKRAAPRSTSRKQKIRGPKGKGEAPKPPAPKSERSTAVHIRARLVSAADGRLVIEFPLDPATTWRRPKRVQLALEGGMRTSATVDGRSSTRDTTTEVGSTTIRLVLKYSLPAKVQSLRFTVAGREWMIQL